MSINHCEDCKPEYQCFKTPSVTNCAKVRAVFARADTQQPKPAESQAAEEEHIAPIPSGKTRAELDKDFEEFSRSLRSNYKEMTGRDYDTDFSIKHAPRDQSKQLAAAQAQIAELEGQNEKLNIAVTDTVTLRDFNAAIDRAEKAEARVAVLEKALQEDKARLDWLDTLPKYRGWSLHWNERGCPHLMDTTYGTNIREAIDSAKQEILTESNALAAQPSREKEDDK